MARITVEDCLTKETNRFSLVLLASKRTKQLLRGARVVLTEKRDNKHIVTSLREIAEGKVRFMTEEEAREARLKSEAEGQMAAETAAEPSALDLFAPREEPAKSDLVIPGDFSGSADSNGNSSDESF